MAEIIVRELDLESVVRKVIADIQEDINWVYPLGSMDEERSHGAFLRIEGRISSLKTVLNFISRETKRVEITCGEPTP
jgi:predicted nucleotide-binding protein (sugar kinase/HSP70/actin superfamily)